MTGILALLFLFGSSSSLSAQEIVRVNADARGRQGNGNSFFVTLSRNGQSVLVQSFASNVVPGVSQGLFVRDIVSGVVENVHRSTEGIPGNCCADKGYLSADGRIVALDSDATNLAGGGVSRSEVYLHYRDTGETFFISHNGQSSFAESYVRGISDSGNFVILDSIDTARAPELAGTNTFRGCFIRTRGVSGNELVSVSASGSYERTFSSCDAVSNNGRYVLYHSDIPDIVPGDTNDHADLFLKDRQLGTTVRVGQLHPTAFAATNQFREDFNPASMTPDGSTVVFYSGDTPNIDILLGVYIWRRDSGAEAARVSHPAHLFSQFDPPGLTSDGNQVALSLIYNGLEDNATGPVILNLLNGTLKSSGFPNRFAQDENELEFLFTLDGQSLSGDGTLLAFNSSSKYLNRGYQPSGSSSFDLSYDSFTLKTSGCPSDPGKMIAGRCGCGHVELDSNRDGVIDCGRAATVASLKKRPAFAPFAASKSRLVLERLRAPRATSPARRSLIRRSSPGRVVALRARAITPSIFHEMELRWRNARGAVQMRTVTQPLSSNVVNTTRIIGATDQFLSARYRQLFKLGRQVQGRSPTSAALLGPTSQSPKSLRLKRKALGKREGSEKVVTQVGGEP